MTIQLETDVTEYYIVPTEINTINVFTLQPKAMIINFMDDEENVLEQSEISREDALALARHINNFYNL